MITHVVMSLGMNIIGRVTTILLWEEDVNMTTVYHWRIVLVKQYELVGLCQMGKFIKRMC